MAPWNNRLVLHYSGPARSGRNNGGGYKVSLQCRTASGATGRLRLAVSLLLASLVVALGASTAGAATTWTPTVAPLPPDAPHMGTGVNTQTIACPAATWCVGGGGYVTAGKTSQGLLDIMNHGSWRAIRVPLPPDAATDPIAVINAVDCSAVGACAAVGRYTDADQVRRGLIVTLSKGAWKATAAPLPTGVDMATDVTLVSVSCPRTPSCVASGRYIADGVTQGLIEAQSGAAWQPTTSPLPADAADNPYGAPESVSCPAAGQCIAVEGYTDRAGARVLSIDTLTNGSWTATRAPSRPTRSPIQRRTSASSGVPRFKCVWP